MLVELRIRNVAVIDSVTLRFSDGLNVVTGETGAGKSLIVGALGLLLGDRAASDRIREGADRASVEGVFEVPSGHQVLSALDARGIELDSAFDVAEMSDAGAEAAGEFNVCTIVLKREVANNGRSRAWVNGSPVTAGVLAEIGALLVTVHGQQESRSLIGADHQMAILDAYVHATAAHERVSRLHDHLAALRRRKQELASAVADALRRSDYLKFVIQEISSAQLRDGEDESLDAEIRKLSHAGELKELSGKASQLLSGDDESPLALLSAVRRLLSGLVRLDPDCERMQVAVDSALYSLEDLGSELSQYSESVEHDPTRLETLESRRELIHVLKRKYGPSIDDIRHAERNAIAELERFELDETQLKSVDTEIESVQTELQQAAKLLTSLRSRGSEELGESVSSQLPSLGMEGGRLSVRLIPREDIGPHGAESVQFEVSLNGSENFQPLSRVASGGELSRIMLGLSTVLARLQEVPTLVFDEIDSGVGGAVAWQVGSLMRDVAMHHQVLAISHLAQIAARAHNHLVVLKSAVETVTTADTRMVSGEDRVVEIARMLGGDAEREVSRAHARELLERGCADDSVMTRRKLSEPKGKPARK